MNYTSLPENIEHSTYCRLNEIVRKLNEVREMVGNHWPDAIFSINSDEAGSYFYISRHKDSIECVQSDITAEKWEILNLGECEIDRAKSFDQNQK